MDIEAINRGPGRVPGGLVTMLAIAVIALAVLIGFGAYRYGSVSATIAALRAESIAVDSAEKSFGTVEAESTIELSFRLTNVSYEPVRIAGARTSCTCLVAGDQLPLAIPPGESRVVRFAVHPPASPPQFRQSIELYTDVPDQPSLDLTITGRVRRGPSETASR